MTSSITAIDRLRKAIIELQKPQPFFAHIIMRMRPAKFSEALEQSLKAQGRTPTMAVDPHGNLMFSEEFFNELTDAQIQGTLCHESLHVALAHLQRLGERNLRIANIAMDVSVNMMVLKSGLELPKDGIPVDVQRDTSSFDVGTDDKKCKIHIDAVSDKTWEEIFAIIIEQLKNQDMLPPNKSTTYEISKDGNRKDQQDEHIIDENMSSEEREEWKTAIAEAAAYAKQRGLTPAGMDRVIDKLLKPKVHWKNHLLQYVRPYLQPVDWTYQTPNKKSQALGVFLPATHKERMEVEILIDTSGSISTTDIEEFLAEVVAIKKASSYVDMHVGFADTKLCARYQIKNGSYKEILNLKPKGGGGTHLETALDEIKKINSTSPVVIVITDGEDSYSKSKKDYPFDVLWVVSRDGVSAEQMRTQVSYGKIIKMD